MAYVNPIQFAPNLDPFAAAERGFTMADLLRKRNFGREMDTQARDFDITSPQGQIALLQALSQAGYGREVADLQKSHFDPDSREKQFQYSRDNAFRGLMERMSPYQTDPLAGLELDEAPSSRFTQPPQGRFQEQPMPGQPGGTQDLRADWLKGLMGMFGGGQQGPSYGMPQAPGQGNYGTPQIPAQAAPMAPMPSQPGTDPALGAAVDRSLHGIPDAGQTLPNQGIGASDSTRLMKEATDRFLAGQQQAPAPRPGMDDDRLAWEAVRHGQMSVGDYLQNKRLRETQVGSKTDRPQFKLAEDGTILLWDPAEKQWVRTNEKGLKPPGPKPPRPRFRFETINGRRIQINLDTGEKEDLGPAEGGTVKDLTPQEVEKLTTLGSKRDEVESITTGYKPEYSGLTNKIQNIGGKYTGANVDQVSWWQSYDSFVNQIRNDLFGASLTPGEKKEFEKTIVTTEMHPTIAARNLAKQLQIINDAVQRKRNTYRAGRRVNQEQVDAALGPKGAAKGAVAPYSDAEKEARYQAWKAKQGKK